MNRTPYETESAWPHRLAVALVCATFPLIWIGGLVTTYGAGMAVPDWPNTYGYNLFLYPLDTWVEGPWKLFVEHGHRLYASAVGLLTIGLVVASFCCQRRASVRWLSVVALVAVVFQGALGGLRVIENEVQLAKIHGCLGPAFFSLSVALAVITSRRWQQPQLAERPNLGRIERLAVLTTLLAYCQLVLGSQLRHLPAGGEPGAFRTALFFHLATAAALAVHIVLLNVAVLRTAPRQRWLARPTLALAALIVVELCLGSATWVMKYSWPSWLAEFDFAAAYTVVADARPQAWITTAHVATGSLILATSTMISLRSVRLAWGEHRPWVPTALVAEVAL